MGRVTTTTSYVNLDGDYSQIEGVEVTCDRCGHSEESFGTSSDSLRRCATLMRENCPRGERNFYEVEDDEDEHVVRLAG
jgi:hypothetical protein